MTALGECFQAVSGGCVQDSALYLRSPALGGTITGGGIGPLGFNKPGGSFGQRFSSGRWAAGGYGHDSLSSPAVGGRHPPQVGPAGDRASGLRLPHPVQSPFPDAPPPPGLLSPLGAWRSTAVLTSLLTTLVTSSKCFSFPGSEPRSKKPKLISSGWGAKGTHRADAGFDPMWN